MNTLRLIPGDQLNPEQSWFDKTDNNIINVMMGIKSETGYVKHHLQKLLCVLGSMRHFASHPDEHVTPYYMYKIK